MTRCVVAVMLLLGSACVASAQELEYNLELGGMVGGNLYVGDANNTLVGSMGMAGGVLARYNINPRMAVRGNLAMSRIKGTTVGKDNKFPEGEHSTFSRNVFELGAQYECHFFAYGTGEGYKDTTGRFGGCSGCGRSYQAAKYTDIATKGAGMSGSYS